MKTFIGNILAFAFFACIFGRGGTPSEASKQNEEKIDNANRLMANQPTPKIDYSMDRYLLTERLVRLNDPNKMTYLYVVMQDGTWLKVTIVGKLASTGKRLTSPDGHYYDGTSYWEGASPDEMGTYGSSQPDKVGMTTMGSLLEFGGFASFIYSEVPLKFQGLQHQVVEVTLEVNAQERERLSEQLARMKKIVNDRNQNK